LAERVWRLAVAFDWLRRGSYTKTKKDTVTPSRTPTVVAPASQDISN
jgi:hypothetical protein